MQLIYWARALPPSCSSVCFIRNTMVRFHHSPDQNTDATLSSRNTHLVKSCIHFLLQRKPANFRAINVLSLFFQHYYLENYFLLPTNLFLNLKYIVEERLSYQKSYSPRSKIQINISFSHPLGVSPVIPYNEIFLIELLTQTYKSFSAGC